MRSMRKFGYSLFATMLGPALFLLALAVYFATLSKGACPGESAIQIAQYSGLTPRITPLFPLWTWLVGLVSMIPMGGLAIRLNILSAVCGALSVWLLYSIVKCSVYGIIEKENVGDKIATVAAMLAGIVSALFFAFCVSFWTVSNRAHMASFHILFALLCAWFFMRYAFSGNQVAALVFGFLYSVGCVEFATFIVFAPLFGFGLLFLMVRHSHFRPSFLIGLIALSAAGLFLYLVAAGLFVGTENWRLSGCGNIFDVVWLTWRTQFGVISKSLPTEGWLLVLISCAAPWLAMLAVARSGLNGERDRGLVILHAIMTGFSLMVVFETGFSPGRVLSKYGLLLVTPNLLVAIVLGYLASYWLLALLRLFPAEDNQARTVMRYVPGLLVALTFLVVAGVVSFRNADQAGARSSEIANTYATETIKSMSGRTWLVTDGGTDVLLLIAAKDLGVPLRILNLSEDRNDMYMSYVASYFDQPWLKNMSHIGMLPLLERWFVSDPDIDKKVAFLVVPDLLTGAGMTAVPNKMVFLGAKEGGAPNSTDLMETHRAFWRAMVPEAKKADAEEIAVRRGMFAANTLRQMSMVANNLGVLMEDRGRSAEAFEAYSKAREIEPGNVSALLNMESMIVNGSASGDVTEVRKTLGIIIKRQKVKLGAWALARYFGYVRSPAAFAELASVWASLGRSGVAVASLTKALKLCPANKRKEGMWNLAALYLSIGMHEQAEDVYKNLLAEDAGDGLALLGLAGIARAKMNLEKAGAFLKKAEGTGISRARIALERANLHIAMNAYGQARMVLEKLVETSPELLAAWQLLGEVLLHDNELAALDACLKRMAKVDGGQPAATYLSAMMALRRDDPRTARRLLEQVLASRSDNPRALEQLMRLDVAESGKDKLYAHAKALLRIDPDHALANYAMGSFQDQQGNNVLAEDLYRRSLMNERLPQALNDLAWLLQKRGEFEEAERLVREAIVVNAKMPLVWDTLGVILAKSDNSSADRLAEAEKAFETALSLAPNGPLISLHMADLQARTGKMDRARELVSKVLPKRARLGAVEQKELDSLVDRLGVKK